MRLTPSALFFFTAPLFLGACANNFEVMEPEPVSSLTPLEMLGRQVLSSTGRDVGWVEDVVLDGSRRPEQVVVTIGSPMTMHRRHVPLGLDEGVFSAPQNAIILNETITPEQLAMRPDVRFDGAAALRQTPRISPMPTDWRRATVPR